MSYEEEIILLIEEQGRPGNVVTALIDRATEMLDTDRNAKARPAAPV